MQFNFKKVLACALSAAMVLTVAPMAGINANAAAKVKLSATKGTITVGKTKKVTIKNTKKSNITKVTFKYSKKNIAKATWKKATANKITIKGLKAGKTKITATIKLKNKVAGKKTYKLTYTATVKKAADAKVAVTGVTLSNSTPKVGDTITANVEPSDATNVVYAWYTGDTTANISTPVAGVTGNSLTVSADMVGKFIQVVVTGDNDSTATKATSVAVQEAAAAEIAVTAKQIKAKKVEVAYTTGEYSEGTTVKVTKGSQDVAVASTTASEDKKTLTLTMKENLTDGEFKVVVTTSAKKTGEATFTGAKPVLTEVKFTNNNLAVSSNTTDGMKKGYAHIESTDQFGDHMNLTSPTFTCSKGDVSFKSDTGVLTLDASNTSDKTYKLGEMVVVSVMYDNNTKVLPATLTVTTAAMVKTLTFGDIQSDDAKAYPVDKITQTNLNRGVYYFPVTEAKDDSGIDLDADRLNDMLDSDVQTLFVTPNSQDGTIIYADQFSEKTVDGKKVIALVVKGGSELSGLNAGVDMSLAVFSVGGVSSTLPVKIVRDAVIQNMEIDIPELYVGKTAEIKFSATDTNGAKVDLYKMTSNLSLAGQSDAYNSAAGLDKTQDSSAALRFWDTAKGSAAIGTKINISVGNLKCAWELVRNATNHEVSLKITPAVNGDVKDGYLNMTGTTAAYTAITKANIKINASRTTDGVNGFDSAIATKVLNTTHNAQVLSDHTDLTLNDGDTKSALDPTYGAVYVSNDSAINSLPTGVASVTVDGQTFDGGTANYLLYSMEISGKDLIPYGTWHNGGDQQDIVDAVEANLTGTPITTNSESVYFGNGFILAVGAASGTSIANSGSANLYVLPDAVSGKSDTVKIKLYKVSKIKDGTSATDTRVELLGTKSVTFSVENEDTASYKLVIDKTDKVLYAGEIYSDVLPFTIETEGGAKVDQAKLKSVKVINTNNDGARFDYDGGIICTSKSNAKAGTVNKATINAVIETNGDSVEVSQEFDYQTNDPIPTNTGLFGYRWGGSIAGNAVSLGANQNVIGEASPFIRYQDQYYTDCQTDGLNVSVEINSFVDKDGQGEVNSLWGTYSTDGDAGKVTLYGDGTIETGDTFQVVINGGKGLTLYVTATGNTTLSEPAPEEPYVYVANAGTAGAISGKVDAPAAGKVYLLNTAQYATWKANLAHALNHEATTDNAGDYLEASAAIAVGFDQTWTITPDATEVTAGSVYYAVFMSDADPLVATEKKFNAATATLSLTESSATANQAETGGAISLVVTLKDQFGNNVTSDPTTSSTVTVANVATTAGTNADWTTKTLTDTDAHTDTFSLNSTSGKLVKEADGGFVVTVAGKYKVTVANTGDITFGTTSATGFACTVSAV